ncbi:HD domain-containing protein [Oceanospirillum sp. D5]|uniref:HD domain-containing protein n=2 Tax=Oceanospirillum sediminis TaxID=2760088 RepID=A0A839IQK3_9GAMM|nr:HD domain-containing protein [Oceanospirillum sediminis]
MLMVQSYQSNKQALLIATTETAQQLSLTIDERAQRITGPAKSALQILSHDPLLQAETLNQRMARLPVLVEALQSNEVLSAIYAGYPNGEFFLIRKVTPIIQNKYHLGDNVSFMLQAITQTPQGMQGSWSAYDQQLQLISKKIKSDYQYDPRTRSWYTEARKTDKQVLTSPYLFYTTREIGITLAQKARTGKAVIGMDASVKDLSAQLASLRLTENTELAVVDSGNRLLAYTDQNRMIIREKDSFRLNTIDSLNISPLTHLAATDTPASGIQTVSTSEGDWFGLWLPVSGFQGNKIRVLIAIPENELLASAKAIIWNQLTWAITLTIAMLALGLYSGARIGRAFKQLTRQVRALSGFDFSQNIHVNSVIREARELGQVADDMAGTIYHFQQISSTLNRERDLELMLHTVLTHLVSATRLQDGAIYLYDAEKQGSQRSSATTNELFPEQLKHNDSDGNELKETIKAQLNDDHRYLIIPLRKRDQKLEGFLVIYGEIEKVHHEENLQQFIEQLSGSAAVAIETRRLLHDQKAMIEGILKLLADSIDSKSPYTSGHCERVPKLAISLVNNLESQSHGQYADFSMSEQEHEAFRIAAWLHDCGKILSQEHVIDKATKLETIYNRIHEVRTRFEVLWRDTEITYWKNIARGLPEDEQQQQLTQRQQQLRDDFDFIACINEGSLPVRDEQQARLERIANTRWLRYFDNRKGLSQDELNLLTDIPQQPLPASEKLLNDRPEHIVDWQEGRKPPVAPDDPANIWGFNMPLPEHSFNFGECYNLKIPFGTLTTEERFKINEHIVHTIMMLSSLPLPDHLKKVPELAGNHHERMDGKGYPRGLHGDEMSIPEKVMAIADIFEALTASDRPYKKPKSVSQAMSIMVGMTQNGHIDQQLFHYLVSQDAFTPYSKAFLQPDQLDFPETADILSQLEEITETA